MADVLLVHGSCHGAWCWRDVIPHLETLGHRARAIDLPGHGKDTTPIPEITLDAYARAICDSATPDTILVGHSMGGYAITAAAERAADGFAQLVYLCAYVPQDGFSLSDMRKMAPRQPLLDAVQMADDKASFTIDPAKAPALFYNDCPEHSVRFAMANLCPQAVAPTNVPFNVTDRSRNLARHYIRCLNDQTIPPEFQITMSKDWDAADVQDMTCGHSPFFADPSGLAHRLNSCFSG